MGYADDTQRALLLYLEAPSTQEVFSVLREKRPELRSFSSVAELLAFFRDSKAPGKSAVLRALCSAYQKHPQFVYLVVALVMLPALLLLVRPFLKEDELVDEVWGDILSHFGAALEESVRRGDASVARLKWETFERLAEQSSSSRQVQAALSALRRQCAELRQVNEELAVGYVQDALSQDSGERLSHQELSLVLRGWIAEERVTPGQAHLIFLSYVQGHSSERISNILRTTPCAIRKRQERLRALLSQDIKKQALSIKPTKEDE